MSTATLAAITLHPRGGGVAAVSRLIWEVLRRRCPGEVDLVTLIPDERAAASTDSGTAARVAFGSRLAARQITGRSRWIFFSHLSLTRVQQFVPEAFRRPYAVFLHGIEAWRPLPEGQRQLLSRAALRVTNSKFTAARVRDAHPDVGPIFQCPLAVPPDYLQRSAATASADRSSARSEVLVVGRMLSAERYKGHDQLLDVWPQVLRSVPAATLVFAGDGDDAGRLRRRAAACGVAASVRFEGFVSDETLAGLYRRAAILAMPSRGEGFGLVYLEAMANGLPCIGSVHDAAGEIIEDGVTGFLVDQQDVSSLATRVIELLTDERRRRSMGEAGRSRVAEQFSFEAFERRMVNLIDAAFGIPAETAAAQAS